MNMRNAKMSIVLVIVFMLCNIVPNLAFTQKVYAADPVLDKTGWVTSAYTSYDAVSIPEFMTDGVTDIKHRWASGVNQKIGDWVQVDMKRPITISSFAMTNASTDTGFAYKFDLFISNDETNWKSVASNVSGQATTMVAIPAQSTRYIKVVLVADYAGWWNIHEINVNGIKPVDDFLNTFSWEANASTSAVESQRMLDGRLGLDYAWTSGVGQQAGDWVEINMKEYITVNKFVMLSPDNGIDYAKSFDVYVSTNRVEWGDPVASVTGNPGQSPITFATTKGKYIKIVLTQSDSTVWNIQDFYVYGTAETKAIYKSGWLVTSFNSYSTSTPDKMIDGALSAIGNRWLSGATQSVGDWFQIDMKVPTRINKLLLNAEYFHGEAKAIQVFLSNDGINWGDPVASVTGSALTNAVFKQQSARYIKVVIKTPNASQWWSISELDVFGPETIVIPSNSYKLDRVNWTATAVNSYTQSGWTPDKMLDGMLGTNNRWASGQTQGIGDWIIVDMKAVTSFNTIVMQSNGDGGHAKGYQVFFSNDGVNWGSEITNGDGADVTVINFPSANARYIKVVLTKAWTSGWWNVHEFNVYNVPVSSAPITYTLLYGEDEFDISHQGLQTGDIRLDTNVVNYAADVKTGELMVALYKKDTNQLVDFVTSGINNLNVGTNFLSITINIPDDLNIQDYRIKAFLWDNAGTQLIDSKELGE